SVKSQVVLMDRKALNAARVNRCEQVVGVPEQPKPAAHKGGAVGRAATGQFGDATVLSIGRLILSPRGAASTRAIFWGILTGGKNERVEREVRPDESRRARRARRGGRRAHRCAGARGRRRGPPGRGPARRAGAGRGGG